MALTYDQSSQLSVDGEFRGRVKIALMHFAAYILDESPATPAHNTRYQFAQNVMASPDGQAGRYQPAVVMDAAVQNAGLTDTPPITSAIDDAGLQTAVETTINKLI